MMPDAQFFILKLTWEAIFTSSIKIRVVENTVAYIGLESFNLICTTYMQFWCFWVLQIPWASYPFFQFSNILLHSRFAIVVKVGGGGLCKEFWRLIHLKRPQQVGLDQRIYRRSYQKCMCYWIFGLVVLSNLQSVQSVILFDVFRGEYLFFFRQFSNSYAH